MIYFVLLGLLQSSLLFGQQAELKPGLVPSDTIVVKNAEDYTFQPEFTLLKLKPSAITENYGLNAQTIDSVTTINYTKTHRNLQFDTIYKGKNWLEEKAPTTLLRYPPLEKASAPRYKDQALCDVQYLDVDQGLSSSYILSMLLDSRGLLWFGTHDGGLIRYNGHTFTNFRKQHGLPGNSIRALYEDSKGNIWIGTQGNGLIMTDGHKIIRIPKAAGLSEHYIYKITEDLQHRIWISTRANGVYVITENAILQLSQKNGLPDNEVFSVYTDTNDSVWLGTGKGPVLITQNDLVAYQFIDKESTNQVKTFIKDIRGNLWIGTHRNPVVYDGTHFLELHLRLKVKSFQKDESGNIWTGTAGYGVFKITPSGINYDSTYYIEYLENHGLSHNYVSDLILKNGLLWLGTYGGGVNRLNIHGFHHITSQQGLKSENIWAFAEDHKKDLWLGTETAGIAHFRNKLFAYYDRDSAGMKSHIVLSAMRDHTGNLWFGTYKGGVYKINNGQLHYLRLHPKKKRLKIISMLADSKGNLWFGSWDDGVFRLRGDEVWHITKENGLSHTDVFDIMEDNEGNIWFATDGGGLTKFDGQRFFHFDTTSGLKTNSLYTIMLAHDNSLWLGTYDSGIMVVHDTAKFYISKQHGLSSDNIQSIMQDRWNRIWVGTDNGLNLIQYSNSDAILKSADQLTINTFSKEDGLKGLDFHTNAAFIDHKQRAWWGTGKSLTNLDLNTVTFDSEKPQVIIEALQIKQRWIDFHNLERHSNSTNNQPEFEAKKPVSFFNRPEILEIPFKSRHLTFHYATTDWRNFYKIQFQTRLFPLEENWSLPTSEQKADFRNIPPGDYQFEVRAIGANGIKSDVTTQKITVHPPWWMTLWAYLAYASIILTLIILLHQWRTRMLKRRQKELENIVKQRTAEVQEKNEELNILVEQVTEQRNEIATQRDMVVKQRDQLEQVNKAISQSIDYAERIQASLMPERTRLKKHFPDSFLLFKPRDIVSGDFYWWAKIKNTVVVVAADCTGHGVPGAFMSMLGMSFLREIVMKEKITAPDKILNHLREDVIQALQQKNRPGEQRDGLDMTVLSIDNQSRTAKFAGAYNSIYHVREQKLEEYHGNRFPIAAHPKMKEFESTEIMIKPGDRFYMFSDGYHDQFNEKNGRKIKKGRFQEIILQNHQLDMEQQKEKLIQYLETWQGNEEQIDDILVMGFHIP